MTQDAATVTPRRPAVVKATIGTLSFLGLTALLGGIELTFGLWMTEAFPSDWLDRLPLIDSWVVPGLVLGVGFGLGSLVTAYGVLRQPQWALLEPVQRLTGRHWSWLATILIGLGLLKWIGLELIYLPERSWLEIVYGTVALVLVLAPLSASARRHFKA